MSNSHRRRDRPDPVPAWDRPPGWYTEPARAWFGEHWKPSVRWGRDEVMHSQASTRGRETQIANGIDGSVQGLSKLADEAVARYRLNSKKMRGIA